MFWLVHIEPNMDYKAESVWVVFLYCSLTVCSRRLSTHWKAPSCRQSLIPCQHWCHKWPHFSASYWSIWCDTALLFDVQLTNSRHCSKWSDLSPPLTHSAFFSPLFSHLFLPCSSFNSCCRKKNKKQWAICWLAQTEQASDACGLSETGIDLKAAGPNVSVCVCIQCLVLS